MAITTKDGLVAAIAAQQRVQLFKNTVRTSIANAYFSVFDIAGNPGAGTLAGTSTAAGVVPTSATAGCPILNAFGGANLGYITSIEMSNTVAGRMALYDMVFKAGAYAFNASQTLASQPSYSTRMPSSGTDYTGTSIWVECVTAFTGNMSIAVTYTNQAGTTGRTTGTIATGIAPTLGRMIQLPLQAGDTGVQKIETVTATVATVGTFNILVLRQLFEGRIRVANDCQNWGPDIVGMPQLTVNAALIALINADSTSTGLPEISFGVANG